MSTMLYLQTDKNIRVSSPDVYLKDIANLSCSDPAVLAKMQALKIRTIKEEQYGRYPMAVTDIVKKIQALDSNVDVTHIGEPNFIMTFEDPSKKRRLISVIKIIFVCIVTFIGTAFSIMTFNSDVDIPKLFEEIYVEFTGMEYTGFTVLEISYSIGIGLGAVFFSTILENENLLRIRHRWRLRCVRMRIQWIRRSSSRRSGKGRNSGVCMWYWVFGAVFWRCDCERSRGVYHQPGDCTPLCGHHENRRSYHAV